MFLISSTWASSDVSTLNPRIILSSSGSVFARYTSFLEIGPMSALIIRICFCFSRTSRASSEPSESALTTTPDLSVVISLEISSLNSFVIFSNVCFSVITWNGMPGRISSFEFIWSLIPVAASTFFSVLNPLFNGWASWMFRIFVVIGLSKLAIAILSVDFSLPSYRMHSRKFEALSFLTSRTTPFAWGLILIWSFRNFWERAVRIARISGMPSPVSAEHGIRAMFFVKSSILEYISALNPCEWRAPINV